MAPGVDTGDTAWMLAATALVLLMTPALGLFYAGLVRSKNTLNTFMMCVAALAIATISWALVGYSVAFAPGNAFIGGLDHLAGGMKSAGAGRRGASAPVSACCCPRGRPGGRLEAQLIARDGSDARVGGESQRPTHRRGPEDLLHHVEWNLERFNGRVVRGEADQHDE